MSTGSAAQRDRHTRNGTTSKMLVTEHGPVRIDAPRDRKGTFDPRLVRKRQRRF
jgi:putative transposase